MTHPIMLPDGLAPSNLHLRSSVRVRYIESDVLDICDRLAAISPRLFLVELTDADVPGRAAWAVMEMCGDGVARRVNKYQELDQRMLTDVQRMLRIPFEHRLRAAEEEIERAEQRLMDDKLEELYETIGHEFLGKLDQCNFITQRPTSYPKAYTRRGQAARRS